MDYNYAILTVTTINLVVCLGLIFFLVRIYLILKDLTSDKHKHLDLYYSDLLERIQRIERNNPVQAAAEMESRDPVNPEPADNRIKSVTERLRDGGDPDQLRKEHGYSRSEMGLLLASAGLASNAGGSE
jgi:hypothetical protein